LEEIEATGIPAFLAEHPPFAGLDREALLEVAASSLIEFFPAGEVILTELGEPAQHIYVVRRGAVGLTSGGHTVDILQEGEMFGHPSVLSGRPPALGAEAHEDTICLLLPTGTISAVFGTKGGLGFLVSSLRRRGGHMRVPAAMRALVVGSVVRRPLIQVGEDATVSSVASVMTENDVSGVMVNGELGTGIVTDRDLRERVLAHGLGADTPVGKVVTRPVRVVDEGDLVDDVLIGMLDQGLTHMPVRSGDGYLGMLEVPDAVAAGMLDPFDLRASIEAAPSDEALVAASVRIPEIIAAVIDSGVAAPQVGRMVTSLTDALTTTALRLASDGMGEAPVAWAWVTLGSQARREQGLATDQDHMILYDDGGADEDRWFETLAGRVVAALERCGVPRCPNGVMASEPAWRSEARLRIEGFREATWEHDRVAALFAGLALDHRQVAGDFDATRALEEMRHIAAANPGFVVRSGELALDQQPPIGFLGNLVVRDVRDHEGVLNIKVGGIHPVVELARFLALAGECRSTGTMERVREAARAGVIDEEDGEGLIEAFTFLVEVRLRHQVDNWRKSLPPDNLIDPGTLGPLARSQLKDAFGMIREMQRQVERQIAIRPR
jgi:CBS domain-containing protein